MSGSGCASSSSMLQRLPSGAAVAQQRGLQFASPRVPRRSRCPPGVGGEGGATRERPEAPSISRRRATVGASRWKSSPHTPDIRPEQWLAAKWSPSPLSGDHDATTSGPLPLPGPRKDRIIRVANSQKSGQECIMGESHFMVGLNSFWSAGASCSGLQAQVDERSSRRRCQL